MKKTLSLIAIASSLLLTSQANAKDSFYAGADVLWANAKHRYYDRIAYSSNNGDSIDSDSINFGVNAGYKANFGKAFIAPEIFYDHINTSTKDFSYLDDPNTKQDRMEINSRYGIKLNLGYNFFSKFSGFVNAGAANVSYNNRWPSENKSHGATKFAMIYGLGLLYEINDKWSVRTSYDRQTFNTQYVSEGLRDKVRLDVVKLGAVYSF